MKTIISPSILAADFAALGEHVHAVEKAGAQWLHLDVMDGHYVPNISFGSALIKSLRPHSRLLFDVHLMIAKPRQYLPDFIKAGAQLITFHHDAESDPQKTIRLIQRAKLKAGIAIRPRQTVASVASLLSVVDHVVVMTVEPGFAGQALKPAMLKKVAQLRALTAARKKPLTIAVDGGINLDNAAQVRATGADVLVVGTALFSQPKTSYHVMIQKLQGRRELLWRAWV